MMMIIIIIMLDNTRNGLSVSYTLMKEKEISFLENLAQFFNVIMVALQKRIRHDSLK